MRAWIAMGLWAACLSACAAPERVALEHRSEVEAQTRGVALSPDGVVGQAGMWDTTCDFQTASGALRADYDYPGSDEQVEDGTDVDVVGFTTLTLSIAGAHLTLPVDDASGPVSRNHAQHDLPHPDVRHGRLVRGGVVLIASDDRGCVAEWFEHKAHDPTRVVVLPDSACQPQSDVAVDREERDVFVVTDDGVAWATEHGVHVIPGVEGDLLAWDPWSNALYVSDRGAREVVAVERDGSERWRVELGGRVVALDHLGEFAAASASIEPNAGSGKFVVLDGQDGSRRSEVETPEAVDDIVVSDDGTVLGLVLADAVHFYDVLEVQ